MVTRRRFLLTLPALAAAPGLVRAETLAQSLVGPFRKKPAPAPPAYVYIGTDTAGGVSRGIYLARFDAATGRLSAPQLVAATARPSYLALSPPRPVGRCLYAVNAVASSAATVSSFLINATTGGLAPINEVSAGGAGPCYISVDATGHSAFVANYFGSTVASYRILANGGLSAPVERIDFKDARFGPRGPNAARQDIPHPHSTHLSPDNRFVLVSDLGSDQISVFPFDAASATLGQPTLFTNDRPGSGARHIAFHPNGRWIYSINELDSTIDHLLWTATSSRTAPQGLLVNAGDPVKTIAPGFPAARNTAAEVQVSADGRFLYASNRGEDSLAVFTIAPDRGSLTLLERIGCGGKTPRHFTLSPDQRWLLCGNQDSASITVFRRDPGTGRIGGPIQTVAIDSPMFTLFA
jgi:6-phosphogluconolactonase